MEGRGRGGSPGGRPRPLDRLPAPLIAHLGLLYLQEPAPGSHKDTQIRS